MPEVIFNGPVGRLEGRYHHSTLPNAPLALVLQPDPMQGGTMNHKVPYTTFQLFMARGFSVLRFNFRGVGRSQGEHDRGEGELSDAATALDWLQAINPNSRRVWVAGYSFGAWVGMQLLMRRPEIEGFISVAPPTNHFDFNFLAPCPSSGLIVRGDQDTVIPRESTEALVSKLREQKGIEIDYRVIEGANHFFTDRIEHLVSHMNNHLDQANAIRLAA